MACMRTAVTEMANNEIKITEELRERIFKNKKTHIFYDEWCDWIISLSDADALEIARTIAYGFRGVDHEPQTPTAKVVMLSAKKLIDSDRDKYLVKTAKQIDALDKANATRHDEAVNGRLTARSTAVNGRSTDGQRAVNGGDMVLELDSVLDSDMDMDMDNAFPSESPKEKGDYVSQREVVERIVERWNNLPDCIPKVKNIDMKAERFKMLKERLKTYTEQDVMSAIDNIETSPFLLGDNKNRWVIKFDWFVRPNNFPKVFEGQYNTGTVTVNKPKVARGISIIDEMIARGEFGNE